MKKIIKYFSILSVMALLMLACTQNKNKGTSGVSEDKSLTLNVSELI